ncbi:putative dehydrogenase [Blastopirellula marina DSM 3645]|uniref:Putative dehydrogenase n=2 Tax=Blastopirellula marina TaxID=124 RepID=A3ZX88_9BACT|nr:putative dehydrogenase [Blastopirellula marina DSM 3645]
MKAVITGGSDGIGFAIASAFVAEGAQVWLVARNAEKLATAADSLQSAGTKVMSTVADLSDPGAAEQVGVEVAATWDRVDVLVNNAGMARFTSFSEATPDEIQAQVQLNLLSPYLLTQQLLPLLAAAQGNVINISSTSAHRLIPGRPASVYAMTKGGLNSLTKALALELGPQGVRVNAIAPGTIKTPLTQKMIASFTEERKKEYDQFVRQAFALGRLGEPEEVAHLAVYLASVEAKWTTGSIFIVDGGLSTN